MTDLKTFNKDGRELTLKYFSEDDSEGLLLFVLFYKHFVQFNNAVVSLTN